MEDTPPDWGEAVSASQVARGLGQGPSCSSVNSILHKAPLLHRGVAIESHWLDSASTRSVPVDISGRQPSICAAGHCPGKSAAVRPLQMGKLSQLAAVQI